MSTPASSTANGGPGSVRIRVLRGVHWEGRDLAAGQVITVPVWAARMLLGSNKAERYLEEEDTGTPAGTPASPVAVHAREPIRNRLRR